MITAGGTVISEHHFTLGHAPETPRESASRALSDLPDLTCRLCGLMSPRHDVESFGGFCSESHKWEWLVVIILPLYESTTEYRSA